ncbi:MAG: hypothetical protein GX591_11290 [Planctomycetes bacterium]|nr:hypothetical protein [Planctomycetota bacterium]
MAIEVKCKCGSEYRLDDKRAGQTFSCRICGATMKLPAGVGRAVPADEPVAPPAKAATVSAVVKPKAPATRPAPAGGGLGEFGETLSAAAAAPARPAAAPTQAARPAPASPEGKTFSPIPEPPAPLMTGRPTRPPLSWWLARAILWGLCAGALFLPWYGVSVSTGAETVSESITGYEFVVMVCDGVNNATARAEAEDLPVPTKYMNMPEGSGRLLVGAAMMAFGPCVYVLGLLLMIVIVPIAAGKDGAGAMWPFLTCLVGLGGFVIGWHIMAGSELMAPGLEIASQIGASIGPSGWAYTMALLLVPFTLIARAKPDYRLVQAVQWSKQQSSAGPF